MEFFNKSKSIKLIILFSVIFIISLFLVLVFTVSSSNKFTMATGDINGNYHKIGLIYKEKLKEKGIELSLFNSQGSVENLQLLKDKKVDIALMQNNLIDKNENITYLKGIASLYNEPIFVFYKKNINLKLISQLKNKRVSLGKKGSGTYFISSKIISINGLNENDLKPEFLSYSDSAQKLIDGNIDAVFIMSSFDNPVIKKLMTNENISLFSFSNYKSYKYYSVNLSHLVMPQGYYDLGKNIPDKDIDLLNALATLSAVESLDPKIIESLLITIKELSDKEIDTSLSFESKDIRFPSDKYLDLPIHSASELYFKDGPSFLTKYFSYNAALFISRLKYFLIPLIPFILIFARIIPGIYNFRLGLIMKKKYNELGIIEKEIVQADSKDSLNNLIQKIHSLKEDMEKKAQKIPAQYQRNIYDWKMHTTLIEELINNKIKQMML